jgi:hypothetical protein
MRLSVNALEEQAWNLIFCTHPESLDCQGSDCGELIEARPSPPYHQQQQSYRQLDTCRLAQQSLLGMIMMCQRVDSRHCITRVT